MNDTKTKRQKYLIENCIFLDITKMNGPLKMYKLKPIIDHEFRVDLPNCMYKMKNIHAVRNGTVIGETDPVSTTNENLETFDQVIQFLKNNQQLPEMAALLARQEQILQQLTELKNQMITLKDSLKINKPSNLSAPITGHINIPSDIVINVSPMHPPYYLLAVQKMLANNVYLKIRSYLHSTVSAVPENVINLVEKLENFTPQSNNVPEFSLRIIWKDVDFETELIVSKVPILGEVNILRYLGRIIPALNYESSNVFQVDSFLDVCYLLVRSKTKTERSSLLSCLYKKLGKSEWVLGSKKMSIADIALYSTLKQIPTNEINVSMTRWLEKCENKFE